MIEVEIEETEHDTMVLEHTQLESNDIELICEEATQFNFLWLVRVEISHIQYA